VGCEKTHFSLYKPEEICLNGKTALYNQDEQRERAEAIRAAGLSLIQIRECRVLERLEWDEEMAQFFDSLPIVGPLLPRDGFLVMIGMH